MPSVTTHHTALCLIPPENVWEQIQSIRAVHDKAYPRWMPHINLIYPFAPESDFDAVEGQIEEYLRIRKPIEVEFDSSSLDYFKQKGQDCTFHLRPRVNRQLMELHETLKEVLINYVTSTRPFEAHLTLGQTTTSRIADVMIELNAKWHTMNFVFNRVCMISRTGDPSDVFTIKKEVFLLDQPRIRKEDIPYPLATAAVSEIPPANTCLCIIPPNEFSTRLLHLFEHTSLRPWKPFRIVLNENQPDLVDAQFGSRMASIPKFTLDFGPRSICFNYSTSRLFLKPSDPQAMQVFRFSHPCDGALILGEMEKSDVTEVCERFTQAWSMGVSEFEVDRVHLIDEDGRFQSTFPLRSQCFS